MSEAQNNELSELTTMLGGVLSYSTTGHNKPCGQTIGSNGCGDYCILFGGSPDEAWRQSQDHIRTLEKEGYKLTAVVFVPNDPDGGCYGNPLQVRA